MTPAQINRLRAAYSTINVCSIENFERLKATVGKLPASDIEQLADSGIRFIDTAANSVLCDRGIRSEDARIDHAADVIARNYVRATG